MTGRWLRWVRDPRRGLRPGSGASGRHELGDGLWRADFARIDRASRRVVQLVARREQDTGGTSPPLQEVVTQVRAARELAWQCCLAGYERAPAAGSQVPAEDSLARAHRALSQSATATAQVAQAVVLSGEDALAARRAAQALLRRTREAADALGLP